jgi:SAM-dependent methyltransferase
MNPDCRDRVTTGDVPALLAERIGAGCRYDLLWLTNVLEHVADPPVLLATLGKIVAANGVLVITVPNDFSWYQQTLAETGRIDRPFWVSLPDHLAYFNRESLQEVAEATGWKCRATLADFPIDWFLLHPGSNYVRSRALGPAAHRARITLENALDQRPVADVNAFYSAMAKVGLGRQLSAFLTRC